MPNINLLVFPIDIDSARPLIRTALSLGANIIGASSESNPAHIPGISEAVYLPYITTGEFDNQLKTLLKKYNITHAFTPHDGVWEKFNDLKESNPKEFNFKLCGDHPYTAQWQEMLPSEEWAQHFSEWDFAHQIATIESPHRISKQEYAGLHHHFISTPGQTNEDKLFALASIFKLTPPGDIVEIGALYGKSAVALGWLAHKHHIGNVICVDPWDMGLVEDQGEQAEVLNKQSHKIDLSQVFKGFLINTTLLSNIGYIKDVSENAVCKYQDAAKAGSLACNHSNRIEVNGSIALLHIDGNHRYDFVCKDIECWEPLVKEGGWILVDDYLWAFGDGPQKAGDELLSRGNFDIAFCCSDTLFLRKATG